MVWRISCVQKEGSVEFVANRDTEGDEVKEIFQVMARLR
jgi:hypothetical protein